MTGHASKSERKLTTIVKWLSCLLLAACLLSSGPASAKAEKITVFAAASLKNAMDEIATGWKQKTGGEALIVLAGSSALARQIIQGAPADIFISANARWMDAVEQAGLIEPGSRHDLLSNGIVLIAHGKNVPEVNLGDYDLAAMLSARKLAMALVDAVPAGIYGKAALQSLGMWESVKGNIAQTDNVRAALALVESGEAPLGIVYSTDVIAAENVTIIAAFPSTSHPPIAYPAAIVRGGANSLKQAFLEFLKSPSAVAAFQRQGFMVLDR